MKIKNVNVENHPILKLKRLTINGEPILAFRNVDGIVTVFPYRDHFYRTSSFEMSETEFDKMVENIKTSKEGN